MASETPRGGMPVATPPHHCEVPLSHLGQRWELRCEIDHPILHDNEGLAKGLGRARRAYADKGRSLCVKVLRVCFRSARCWPRSAWYGEPPIARRAIKPNRQGQLLAEAV